MRRERHEIGSGTKLLFTFLSLKVFRHEERERHEIGSGTKHLFTFLSLKVFRHEKRARHNLSMLTAFTSSALNATNARRP